VYPLHKSGWGKIVGLRNEETEPPELRLPRGQVRFPLLTYLTGDGFGFFEHPSNELVLLTKRVIFLSAGADSFAVLLSGVLPLARHGVSLLGNPTTA
jgi:hypothetical protein